MKTLLITTLLAFAFAVSATSAEVQIVVRNDADAIIVNTTITTSWDNLLALEAWRQDHLESYPTQESLFREMIVTQARRIIRAKPNAAILAERAKIEAAKAAEEVEVEAAFQ